MRTVTVEGGNWPVDVDLVEDFDAHPFVRVVVGEVPVAVFTPHDGERPLLPHEQQAVRRALAEDHPLVAQMPREDRPGWTAVEPWPESTEQLPRAAAAAAARKAIWQGDPCRPILVSSGHGTFAVELRSTGRGWTAAVEPLAVTDREQWRAELAEDPGALLLLEVDRVDLFGEAYGAVEADSALAHVEMVLSSECRARRSSLYRLTEGRFAVALGPKGPDANELAATLEELVASLRIPFAHPEGPAEGVLTVSVGVARAGPEATGDRGQALHREAERALDRAKRRSGP